MCRERSRQYPCRFAAMPSECMVVAPRAELALEDGEPPTDSTCGHSQSSLFQASRANTLTQDLHRHRNCRVRSHRRQGSTCRDSL
eukprot:1048782-Prymnesium_polylepis.1